MKVISVQQACTILKEHGCNVTPACLRAGLQQRVYPFGDAIKMQEWVYDIYDVLLMKWIREREGEEV